MRTGQDTAPGHRSLAADTGEVTADVTVTCGSLFCPAAGTSSSWEIPAAPLRAAAPVGGRRLSPGLRNSRRLVASPAAGARSRHYSERRRELNQLNCSISRAQSRSDDPSRPPREETPTESGGTEPLPVSRCGGSGSSSIKNYCRKTAGDLS